MINNKYYYSFSSFLKKRCLENGNDIAFIYNNINYTWNNIDNGSNNVAKDLYNLGVRKGTHVGICGTNSINWIYTFFAIQKLCGIAVLINPRLKPKEIINICNIGDISHLCYSEIKNITTFNFYKESCINIGSIKKMYDISDYNDFTSNNSNIKCKSELLPDDPCIMIYTSGSTGNPKAVLSSAYSILSSISPLIEINHYSFNDTNLAFLPFFHVFGFTTAICGGLLNNYHSVIPCNNNPSHLIELIDKYKITIFDTVPTMMLSIIQCDEFAPNKLSSLRSTILGGSPISKKQMLTLEKLLPNIHFGDIYGMSENALISCTLYNDTNTHITETVGKPSENISVIVKDASGNILPNGTQGEICIKSEGMLIWYYNLPIELQPIDNDGYLRTGDLGYIDEDGYIRLTGRIKELIICGGENISPLEITNALISLNHFSDVVVVGIPDNIKGEIVAAAVILKDGYNLNEDEINKELSNFLSKYKHPRIYKAFNSFPLLSTGKIDKLSIINIIQKELNNK